MRLPQIKLSIPSLLILITLASASHAMGQTNRIPLRYVDEWYDSRVMLVLVIGALLGLLASILWLPRILPRPHRDDNRGARLHALYALIVALVVMAALLLVDLYLVAQFGRQTYEFKEIFFDAFLTRQTFTMLGMGALVFAVVIILWTRFVGDRFYRYMIIPR